MGGRGGSSGLSKQDGIAVTYEGKTTNYYFTRVGNQNYWQEGISGIPEPVPLNMSASEFKTRVEKNGATTRKISETERQNQNKAYKAYRKDMDAFLDQASVSDRTMSKGSKLDRAYNRSMRRKRKR